jgi:hypothetical protein
MTSPEFVNQDGGMERAEQLKAIQEFWRADAVQLNVATGSPDERLAKGMYVVDLLAMVDWENAGRKAEYTIGQKRRRMNDLYLGGLRDATYRHGGSMAPDVQYSTDDWHRYYREHIYPRVIPATADPPANHFELMHALHDGSAKFDY